MRKTDKKIENKLSQLLTEVCDFALLNSSGYEYITHSVNYSSFPESLLITCIFEDQSSAVDAQQQGELLTMIKQKLSNVGIELKNTQKQVRFQSK